MNYTIIAPRIVCNICGEQQWADTINCRECGVSFRFGVPDIPRGQSLSQSATTEVDKEKINVTNTLTD